jgi:hypothetical protein
MIRLYTGAAAAASFIITLLAGPAAAQNAAASGNIQEVQLPAAAEVIERYLRVTGAAAIVRGHTSVRTRAKTEAPAQGTSAMLEEVRARPNKVVVTITRAGRGEAKSGFDGEHAWALDPTAGPRLFTGEELADRRFSSSFDLALRDSALYPVRETLGIAEFSGQKCYRIRLVNVNKRESFECFSVETGYMVAAQRKASTPLGMVDNVLLFSGYREIGGAVFATRIVQEVLGIRQVHTLESVTFDDARPGEFDLPPAVKALIKP